MAHLIEQTRDAYEFLKKVAASPDITGIYEDPFITAYNLDPKRFKETCDNNKVKFPVSTRDINSICELVIKITKKLTVYSELTVAFAISEMQHTVNDFKGGKS